MDAPPRRGVPRSWEENPMRHLVCVAAGLWLLGGAAAGATEAWDLASGAGENSIRAQVARAFAEAVEQATGGEIAITVHSAGSMMRGSDILRAVERGDLALGERPVASLAEHDPISALTPSASSPATSAPHGASTGPRAAPSPRISHRAGLSSFASNRGCPRTSFSSTPPPSMDCRRRSREPSSAPRRWPKPWAGTAVGCAPRASQEGSPPGA